MSKKITLSVPDKLHERLEQWKAAFNFSKLFQDAVADAIRKKEELRRRMKENLDLGQIIERLRREKSLSEKDYHFKGMADGLAWAKAVYYDHLVYALGHHSATEMAKDHILGDYFSRRIADDDYMNITGAGINEYARAYINGWQKGVKEFWQEIKDKL